MEIVSGILNRIIKSHKPTFSIPQDINSPETITPPITGIATQLRDALQKNRVIPSERRYGGMPAIFETSDKTTLEFMSEITAQNPDGYLIGVGVGGIFALLQAFPEGPTGIAIADINPFVVAAGRIMVDTLRESVDFNVFSKNLFTISDEEYRAKVALVARKDPKLAKALKVWHKNRDGFTFTPMSSKRRIQRLGLEESIDISEVIKENFLKLKQLAMKDNIAICLADISNPAFLEAIKALPNFSGRTNVIYLSNILWLAGHQAKKPEQYSDISLLDSATKKPVYVYANGDNLEMKATGSFTEVLAGQNTKS